MKVILMCRNLFRWGGYTLLPSNSLNLWRNPVETSISVATYDITPVPGVWIELGRSAYLLSKVDGYKDEGKKGSENVNLEHYLKSSGVTPFEDVVCRCKKRNGKGS